MVRYYWMWNPQKLLRTCRSAIHIVLGPILLDVESSKTLGESSIDQHFDGGPILLDVESSKTF